MIDWILAEKIAGYVAGRGDAAPPTADLAALAAESERRVTAYTGLEPARPLPPPEGIEPPRVDRDQHHGDAGAARPGAGARRRRASGRCARPSQLALGFVVTTEVGGRARLPGPARARAVRARAARRERR